MSARLRYKVLREHYRDVPIDDPKFNSPLKSERFETEDFEEAAEKFFNVTPAKIKGTDKKTVVETLLTVEEDGRVRPMNRSERAELKFIQSQKKEK